MAGAGGGEQEVVVGVGERDLAPSRCNGEQAAWRGLRVERPPSALAPWGPASGNGMTWPEPNGSGRIEIAATGSGATV